MNLTDAASVPHAERRKTLRKIIVDTETNGLENYDRLWVLCARDVETNEVNVFRNLHDRSQPDYERCGNILADARTVIGHHFIKFDLGVLKHFGLPTPDFRNHLPSVEQYVDTLVLSRLLNYGIPDGHSIEAWGNRLGFPKSTFSDFSQWSQELEDRCILDTELNLRIYQKFTRYLESPQWRASIELEHQVEYLCMLLHTTGFPFDINYCNTIADTIKDKLGILLDTFSILYSNKPSFVKEVNPRLTQKGTLAANELRFWKSGDLSVFSPGEPFSVVEWSEFNPGSPKQVVEKLNEAGWKPTVKTKGHDEFLKSLPKNGKLKPEQAEKLANYQKYGWKVTDPDNLATIPEDAPEGARKLSEYILLKSRLEDLEEWKAAYNPVSGRIHGHFMGMGAWTHRKAHRNPNMANIPALINRRGEKQPYGYEMRSMWKARDGWTLIGVDAEGIQLRVFGHYCRDEKLIKAIVEGKKDDKTDIHSLNKEALGTICNSRESAKTFIYAWLLGAGLAKVAEILQCTLAEARQAVENFIKFYPGLADLKRTQIPRDFNRGWFEGLDGRRVMIPGSEHLVLAGYLQNGESSIMKRAQVQWYTQLMDERMPFEFYDDVHDEWQTGAPDEIAEHVAAVQMQAIVDAGIALNLNCPLAGSVKYGRNWAETH